MPEPDFLEHTLNKDIIEQIGDIMHSTINNVSCLQTTSMTASDHSGGATLSPPCKKRRYEEAAAGDSAASNSTAAASAARSVIQCSNGTLTRLPAQASAAGEGVNEPSQKFTVPGILI